MILFHPDAKSKINIENYYQLAEVCEKFHNEKFSKILINIENHYQLAGFVKKFTSLNLNGNDNHYQSLDMKKEENQRFSSIISSTSSCSFLISFREMIISSSNPINVNS